MNKDELLGILYDKEIKSVYDNFKKIVHSIEDSNCLYEYYDYFIEMFNSDKSYIRLRGFIILCRLSKWDVDNKIDKDINKILSVMFDDKPTIVRQCLSELIYLVQNKKELSNIIKSEVLKIDYLKYKDTVSGLIKNDMDKVLEKL